MNKFIIVSVLLLFFTYSHAQLKVVTNGDVKIGDTSVSPNYDLEVSDSSPSIGLTANSDISNGVELNYVNSTVFEIAKNKAVGNALIDISPRPTDGTGVAYFRFFRTTNTTGNAAFFVHRANNSSAWNSLLSGNNDSYINKDVGNVGIGTQGPSQKLSVNGTAGKPGGGDWATFSDKKLKKDINKFSLGLDEVLKINPVSFKYNGKAGMTDTNTTYVGVIAQEIAKVAPLTVTEVEYSEYVEEGEIGKDYKSYKTAPESYLQFDGTSLRYMMINAIKEQNAMIVDLNDRIAELESLISTTTSDESIQAGKLVITPGKNTAILSQNYPNPFNRSTSINYNIPNDSSKSSINIFGINGKLLKTYDINHTGKGTLEVELKGMSSGNYMYKLVIDGISQNAKKMVLSK